MADLQERLESMSAQRRQLLRRLAARRLRDAARSAAAIPPAPRHGTTPELPASFAQQRMWFVEQMQPGNPAYNCPIGMRLRGGLVVDDLRWALRDLVARHETLRTTFGEAGDGTVVQRIHPAGTFGEDLLTLVDLRHLSPEDQDRAVEQALVDDGHRPFDLARGPVVRASLLWLGDDHHVLLYDVHHIANDGWSVGVFLGELGELYGARREGRAPRLPELSVQYADYAAWQRGRVEDVRDEQLAYWRETLDGVEPLDLPTDRPRPATLSPYGGVAHLDLPPGLVEGLRSLGRAHGASLFMTLMAGLHVLLHRYSGQDDIAVGTAATDRDRSELHNLVGFFPNTVVIRSDLGGAPSFEDALRRVTGAARAAYAHADLPFDVMVRDLAPRRDPGRTPLFDVFFTVDETPGSAPRIHDLDGELIVPDFLTAKFDLGFTVRIEGDRSAVHAIYSCDLYDHGTVEAMLRHYRTLLEAAVADPRRCVDLLDLMDDAEWHRVMREWNDTTSRLPAHECLHERVERQARIRPDAVAIVAGGEEVRFGELDRRANRLAHELRARGAGTGDVVAVCLPKGGDQIAAALGVLKAGGAYLPVDPEYPHDRISLMVEDSRSWGVITDAATSARLDIGGTLQIVLPDSADSADSVDSADSEISGPVHPAAGPDDLAYVIYTSGSTGRPKGIALRHRGAVNNFGDFVTRFGIGPGDAVLGVSSPSFDMSVFDSLGMLGAGGTLVLPVGDEVNDPGAWIDLIRRHGVTVWHSAPALLTLVLDRLDDDAAGLPGVRVALLGGDWIPVSMPAALRRHAPEARFVSMGGATEASMDSTIFEVEETDPDWTSIPYGVPMANQRVYVLDANGQPVPPGVPGELHIGGAGLAREYLHQPELTAERFREHVFAPGFVERLYRTGDRVRQRRDGVLELLGRMDFQVKVHGLRIEPGEIEAALRRHPQVANAVVVAAGTRGETTLAAFVVPADGAPAPPAESLRDLLSQRLPAHMVPSLIVPLDELPRTPNGKIDRRSLREARAQAPARGGPPAGELEERIAACWRDVLGLAELGRDDDFFMVGGDSFSAIRAMHAFDRSLPVVELFRHPTVRALAQRLAAGTGGEDLLYRLTPEREALVTVVCVPYGGGTAASYRPLANRLTEEWALWAVNLPGHDAPGDFEPAGPAVARCAEEVARKITGPVVVYGHCAGAPTSVALALALEERGVDVRDTYVGAALPDPDPETSLARDADTTDEQVHDFLTGLGGFDGSLDGADVSAILRSVRHDLLEASRFFRDTAAGPPVPLFGRLHCVVGEKDPATEGFADRYQEWARYADEPVTLDVIEDGDHYFVRNNAAELARLLQRDYFGPGSGEDLT